MSFIIEDTLSGINTYKAFVDGDWILLDYDAKNKILTHYFDGKINRDNMSWKLSLLIW